MKTNLILFLLLLTSCCGLHTEVTYEYNDITIKRIDECGESTFFYFKGKEKLNGKIWMEYSGINDGFDGYIKFSENGKVEILSGDGYFQSEDIDTNLFQVGRVYAYDRPKIGKTVCLISFSTEKEIEENKENNCEVNINYSIDDNEWW